MTGRQSRGAAGVVAATAGGVLAIGGVLQLAAVAATAAAGAPILTVLAWTAVAALALAVPLLAVRVIRTVLHRAPAVAAPVVDATPVDRLLHLQEVTAARFARQLHDTAMQSLVVAAYLARTSDNPAAEELTEQVLTAERELRDAVLDTRQVTSVRNGLGAACQQLHETVDARDGLQVTWSWRGAPGTDIDYPAAMVAFWAIREALVNTAQHSGADRAHVDVRVVGDRLLVTVTDDGCGFTPGPLERCTGTPTGLSLVSEWAELVGARVSVVSAPLEGCRVELATPLRAGVGSERVRLGTSPRCPRTRGALVPRSPAPLVAIAS
jgi:signal transduction histidine kinase